MGRTLHYEVLGPVSKDSQQKLRALEDRYSKEYPWTCESPCLEYGWTKVCGNELNAHTIIRWIAACSLAVPNEIRLYDEGDALYCPLLLKGGMAKPNEEKIISQLTYWNRPDTKARLHDPSVYFCVTPQETYFKMLLTVRPGFGPINNYIRKIKPIAYLNVRREFGTTNVQLESAPDIGSMISGFLKSQHEEGAIYYDDVKSFPESITTVRIEVPLPPLSLFEGLIQ